jgi:hypothetical protein
VSSWSSVWSVDSSQIGCSSGVARFDLLVVPGVERSLVSVSVVVVGSGGSPGGSWFVGVDVGVARVILKEGSCGRYEPVRCNMDLFCRFRLVGLFFSMRRGGFRR